MAKQDKHDKKQSRIIAGSIKNVSAVFNATVWKAVHIATKSSYNPDNGQPFSFSRADTKKQADKLLKQFANKMQSVVLTGNNVSWANANDKNDVIITTLANGKKIPKGLLARWQQHNLEALQEFNTRTENGMNLSNRIWDVSKQFCNELELAITIGMGEGNSADVLSRDVRQYLIHPNNLFRKVRDAKNNLHLSKAARAYHPGRGVYRSSYKNALRMTATENNMAYRTADYTRWQQMDFVLGIMIKTSPNNHPVSDICDTLQGRYPKDFKFRGWHPWCRCFATPILPNENAFFKGLTADLKGSVNPYGTPVTTMPSRFTKWVTDNTERVKNGSTVPYWIKDNFKNGNIENGLKFGAISTDANTNISDIEKLAKTVGVNIEKPMEHEQANTNQPNPHYAEDKQYQINCQSTVVTYELRRRGMPVEAYGNTAKNNTMGICMGEVLATKTRAAWLTSEGKMPEYIVSKKQVTGRTVDKRGYVRNTYSTDKEIMQDFYNKTSEAGRYHVYWTWDKRKSGHIITMEVFKDGTRRFYDPQTGINSTDFKKFSTKRGRNCVDLERGLSAYRVDNLQPNPIVCRGVVKKAGSNLQTPAVDKEQREWWKKNVLQKDGASVGIAGFEPLKKKDVEYVSETKGRVDVHSSRLENANKNKQERAKFEKEHRMCCVLADNGYKIEMLQEVAGVPSSDILINGKKADLKATKSANNIEKYGKKAILEQDADLVVFEFEEITPKIQQEINKLNKRGIHGLYFIKGNKNITPF